MVDEEKPRILKDPVTGAFLPGTAAGPGRPRKLSYRQALKQEGSAVAWAQALWRKALDPKDRDSARLLEYIGNWLEGAPRQMLTLEADADSPALLMMREMMRQLRGENISSEQVVEGEVRELPEGQADTEQP